MARRSKYKFAALNPGDTFLVEGVDVYSMKNALAGYNSRNERNVSLEQCGDNPDNKGRFTFTCISITNKKIER